MPELGLQPKWRVLIGHQRCVSNHPDGPAVETQDQLKDVGRVSPIEQEAHRSENRQEERQAASASSKTALNKADDDVVRDGQEPPLDEHETTRELFGILDFQVGRVVPG